MSEEVTPELVEHVRMLEMFNKHWHPHAGQAEIGRALVANGISRIFVQCGRKFGKTDLGLALAVRHAMLHPNAQVYIFGPTYKQINEIAYENNRLKNMVPPELFKRCRTNDTECRITFPNATFIKLEGALEFENNRGFNPDLVVLDEFKDYPAGFYEAMEPNLSAKKAPILILGTPPDVEGTFTKLAREFATDPEARFFLKPSWTNPTIDRAFLKKTKQRLIERGDYETWVREYCARFVPGGKNAIFPGLSRSSHVFPHAALVAETAKDAHHLRWAVIFDPGNATTFGVLFIALNPYTRKVYIFDEIYTTDQRQTALRKLWEVLEPKLGELAPHLAITDWELYYDEAASWFQVEFNDRFNLQPTPTQKSENRKENGITLIKDALLDHDLRLSDRCTNLYREMENYKKDKFGRIPKGHDHLIDCLRYGLHALGYTTKSQAPPARTRR
jgi:hypothetical protein